MSNKGLISMAMGVKYGFDIELCNLCKIYMSSIAGFMKQLFFLCFQKAELLGICNRDEFN